MTDLSRTSGQIRQQLKQCLYRHLQKRLRNNYRKAPETCAHNRSENIQGTRETIHVCRWEGSPVEGFPSPRGKVCDSRVLGCPIMAQKCLCWAPVSSKEKIKKDFHTLITSGDRGGIAVEYPDVAALMWVLGSDDSLPATIQEVERELEMTEDGKQSA